MFLFLLISVFIITLSNEVMNMGLLIWSSLQADDPIRQTALVGFWACLGYITAIFIGKYTFKLSLVKLLSTTAMLSGLVLTLNPMSLQWGICLLFRSLFGQIVYARVVTLLPQICNEDELTVKNKKIQLAISAAGVVTMVISPLLAKLDNISWVIAISLILILMALAISGQLIDRQKTGQKSDESNSLKNIFKDVSSASLMFFLTWSVFGTFFIIEVPLLKNMLNASPLMITLFLATGMVTNFLTTKFIPPKTIDNHGSLLFVFSCLGLVLFSFSYINSHFFITMYLSAFVLGIWNALMNVTIYTQVQYLKNDFIRENRYVLYRLICEVGIFTGVMFIYLINYFKMNFQTSLTVMSIFVFVGLLGLAMYCRLDPFKNEFKNV